MGYRNAQVTVELGKIDTRTVKKCQTDSKKVSKWQQKMTKVTSF